MEQQKLLVTMKDIQRYKVLKDVIDKKLKGSETAHILGLSCVHISRLKKRLFEEGFDSLLRKSPASAPHRKISDQEVKQILSLRKRLYYDFNIMHFMDKLHEVHKIPYCYESIRQILMKNQVHVPRKKRKAYRQRRRMSKAGMLVQMDSSVHYWLPLVEDKWWLLAMIDDATNEVPYAQFFPKDTLFANMHVIRRFLELKGTFLSLYVDKASHFTTTRHGGLHYQVAPEHDDTQIERALRELDIHLITANSPQAKGRIEVTFRFFQDRLIKEMRLAKIKTYRQANTFLLTTFLPWYNAKYTHPAELVYMPLPAEKNLDTVFCVKKERTVNKDHAIQFYGQVIQLPSSQKTLSLANRKVDVCLLEDNQLVVMFKNMVLVESKLQTNNKTVKRAFVVENLSNQREYVATRENNR